jgi:hypothetical protein
MAHQIIRQPDGRLATFSSNVGDWVVYDATPEELEDYYAERAAQEARERARETITAVLAGEARTKYLQFTMTYEEACEEAGHAPGEEAK